MAALLFVLPQTISHAAQNVRPEDQLAVPITGFDFDFTDTRALVAMLRDDFGVHLSLITSSADAPVSIDVVQGSVLDVLEQLMYQNPSLRYGTVSGHVVIYPASAPYDRALTLPAPLQGSRLAVAQQLVEFFNLHEPELAGLLGPPVKGSPDATQYTDLVDVRGSNTVAGHLVALLNGDPSLSYAIEPARSGLPILAFYKLTSDQGSQSCDVCCPRDITYANEQSPGCAAGACGAQIVFDITGVVSTGSCEGQQLTEAVTTDAGCIPGSVMTGPGCPIGAGNTIVNCTDTYALCAAPASFPMGTCTETYTQQLFVCGRLVQTAAIAFTVTRTATSCSGTVTRTVIGNTAPAQGAAIGYVLDRSGSMGGTPLANAKAAANQGITTMRLCDEVTVTSFSSLASTNLTLRTITDDSVRAAARAAVNGLSAGGATSIGAGLLEACDQLINSALPTRDYVLLTDGMQNTPPTPQEALNSPCFQQLLNGGGGVTNFRIHAIGFGPGADQLLLSQLASQTGGLFLFIPTQLDSLGLAELFFNIQGEISGEQRIDTIDGTIAAGDVQVTPFAIASDVSTETVTLIWENVGTDLDLELRMPNGTPITAGNVADHPGVSFVSGPGIEYFTLASPDLGSWEAHVIGVSGSGTGYALSFTAQSEIQMDVRFQQSPSPLGAPIVVSARLSEADTPITGASVVAQVTQPTTLTLGSGTPWLPPGAAETQVPFEAQLLARDGANGPMFVDAKGRTHYLSGDLVLFDDGNHSDGAADDGVYANAFTDTSVMGTYTFRVEASGTSPSGVDFTREGTRATAVDPIVPTIVNFEFDDAGPLANGQVPAFGALFSLTSSGPNFGPAVFDSSPGGPNDPGPDPDLLTGMGNVLILQGDGQQTVPGVFDTPDDAETGGVFTLGFVQPVELLSVDLIDICPGPGQQGAIVRMTDDMGNTRTYTVPGGWTTDVSVGGSGFGTLDLTTLAPQPGETETATASEDVGFVASSVVSLQIVIVGSGAVDNLSLSTF
ncbi:MAG: VWA domain-containing protein [bacterium]|nr:VWA domain-containing protein [bacterium]